ncbi:hypothetical protein NIES2109_23780 [Nostoc sp. HK-01]|uniref:Uncharacterized protein n=1 Tax=Anabaenopsis circularis NIES-21 TaxID=1085406 RepID=A0A1Z4GFS2_9CYAN|nr:hypothetical protein [Nostoc cycadae]BAY16344.1 hypothetical protein NIES21_21700 [Anabaenopsis circularis NIES-21]BBD59590.1 hypothetical protein NIES2109_23780 [Nostoc sp. HK-01]
MIAKKSLPLVVFLALMVLPSAASASRVEIRTDDGTTIVDSDNGVKIISEEDRDQSTDSYYTPSDAYSRRRLRRYYRQAPCRRYTSSYTKRQNSYSGRSVTQSTTSTTVCR